MTKYQAIIRLANEPMKIIKWFTNNFNHEVGALGIGEMIDGELYVERLVFPKQIVNGAHVHFKPEDWGPIIQELSSEDISKIIFYWHKHPGSASASQGDEEDTFDVFMGEEAERPFFGFLQTAKKTNGTMDYEARIEMRDPIWASITDVKLYSDEDYEIEELCEKIIKDRISYGNASATDQPGSNTKTETKNEDKPITGSYDYSDFEAFMDVKKKNGAVVIEAADYLLHMIDELLCSPLIKDKHRKIHYTYPKDGVVRVIIQPVKNQINKIYNFLQENIMELFPEDIEDQIGKLTAKYEHYNEETDIKQSNRGALSKIMYDAGGIVDPFDRYWRD